MADARIKKSIFFGAGAGFSLLLFYFIIFSLLDSFSGAVLKFLEMWYLILILVAGFSIQTGLFIYIRELVVLPAKLKLKIEDVSPRVFEWELE